MSSILRALKKLERDSRHPKGNRAVDSKFVPLADTGPRRSRFIITAVVGAGVVCGLVVLAGWYFLANRFQPLPSANTVLSSPDSKPSEIIRPQPLALKENRDRAIVSAPQIKQVETVPTAIKSETVEPTGADGSPPPTNLYEKVLSPQQLPIEANGMIVETSSPRPKNKRPRAPVPPVTRTGAAAKPAAEKAAEGSDEMPELNNPEMKLQAITWSKIPQNRIAVINSRIVREGDSVSGYLITAINQDDVVLNRDGKEWKLYFRIR